MKREWRVLVVFLVGIVIGFSVATFLEENEKYLFSSEEITEEESLDYDEIIENLNSQIENHRTEQAQLETLNRDLQFTIQQLQGELEKYSQKELEDVRVNVILDREYFNAVYEVLSNAEKSIYILMYSMKYYPEYPNDHNSKLLKALIDASKRGVDVMVILEISDFNNNLNQENTETAKYLKRNGVKVKFDSKYIQTHSKVLIVDKRIVVVGSTNWSYYAIDKNTEASVIIYSEEIGEEFAKYFLELWRKYLI